MKNKMVGTIGIILGIIVVITSSVTFAFFAVSLKNDSKILGTTKKISVNLAMEEIYKSERLIPLDDAKIITAINNNCVDSRGYDVCSLYKITLTNNGEPLVLNGYITSSETTNYTTDHLKGQLFSSNLTTVLSTVTTLTNTTGKQYFKIDETNLYSTEIHNTIIVYLAIWLTETGTYQDEDYDKNYFGKIAFESVGGGEVISTFSA